jgi:hypothetical protein
MSDSTNSGTHLYAAEVALASLPLGFERLGRPKKINTPHPPPPVPVKL